MAELDRSEMLGLLERLGAADDQEVLASARSLNARIAEAGLTWDDLLRANPRSLESVDADEDLNDEDAGPQPVVVGEKADDAKLIDQILARKGVSKEMRQSLAELKRGLSDGTTDASDRRYIRALARRMDV